MLKRFTLCILCLCCLGVAFAQTPQIVITEINYNPDGLDDIEFVELYNNGEAVEMEGFTLSGVEYTFPAMELAAGGFILICEHAKTFESKFGLSALEWEESSLGNGGEEIVLKDANGVTVDSVLYDDSDEWSQMPDGFSASLSICDLDAENSTPLNWQSSRVNTNITNGNRPIYASPGALESCLNEPFVYFTRFRRMTRESAADTVAHFLQMENYNGSPSVVNISVGPNSTADANDFELLEPRIEFSGTAPELLTTDILIKNDDEVEGTEFIELIMTVESNVGELYTNNARYYIYDDDTPLDEGIILIGLYSTETVNSSQSEYGVELYALKNIADLSKYSVGVANNGGGTDGIEVPLPAVSVAAGDSYFVSEDSTRFFDFFGFYPDYTHPSIWITGNDAIEVFENDQVIDSYGFVDVDGNGEAWDYDAGWAVRISEAGPNGSEFIISDWVISGRGELTGVVNDSCLMPYPFDQFSHRDTEGPVSVKEVDSDLAATIAPNPVGDYLLITLDQQADLNIQEAVVLNTTGQVLLVEGYSNEVAQIRMNTRSLSPGIYIAQLRTEQGLTALKFIKQ